MDALFVKPSRNADPNAGARRMVQEMQDIVLDEAPDKVALSLDEQRLRSAGRGARGNLNADDWDDALEEASKCTTKVLKTVPRGRHQDHHL